MGRSALLLLAAAVLTACGSSPQESSGVVATPTDPVTPGTTTSLQLVVKPADGAAVSTYLLACDPAGGDHPQAQQACEVLDAVGPQVFEPVPPNQACAAVFGGPQTATVTGTYAGSTIDAQFNRSNGCEIDRWEQLGTTFFNVPLQ